MSRTNTILSHTLYVKDISPFQKSDYLKPGTDLSGNGEAGNEKEIIKSNGGVSSFLFRDQKTLLKKKTNGLPMS